VARPTDFYQLYKLSTFNERRSLLLFTLLFLRYP